jgi:hypothetical protein
MALVCVASQLSVQMHLLLVRHSTCAEHGELIHESEARGSVVAAHSDPLVHAPIIQSGRSQFPLEEDSHCDVVGHRRECLSVGVFHAGLAPAPEMPAQARAFDTQNRTAVAARYTLAPKTSPPRA